jgi:hypothetical protein
VDTVAAGLGVAAPERAPRRRLREPVIRPPAILVAGLLLLAGAIAAAVVALTSGDEAQAEPLGTGVVAIDPATARTE